MLFFELQERGFIVETCSTEEKLDGVYIRVVALKPGIQKVSLNYWLVQQLKLVVKFYCTETSVAIPRWIL